MSQFGGPQPEYPGVAGGPGRPQSITLRAGAGAAEMPDAMDPAHQSLADALRVTYRLLIGTMIVLGVLYFFSGFKAVRESERGIGLLFGRVEGRDLPPGFTFTAPFPFGDLVRVTRSAPEMRLEEQFWPGLSEAEKKQRVDQIVPRSMLSPVRDGYLLTADGAIVHAQWTATYRRADAEKWATNIHPDHERKMVQKVLQGAILRAVATTTIDDLLSPEGDEARVRRDEVVRRAQGTAQARLDAMNSGISIDQLKLEHAIPPFAVRDQFARATSAGNAAGVARKQAEGLAEITLNDTAGAAAGVLIRAIADYEAATTAGDRAEQERRLGAIFDLLEGRAVRFNGETIEAAPAGRVAALLAEADLYRKSIAEQRRAEYQEFRGHLEAFRQNPLVQVHRAWADRLATFLDNDAVQLMFVPEGTRELDIAMNLDPDIQKRQEKAQKLRINELANEERMRKHREQQFKTDTGKQILDAN